MGRKTTPDDPKAARLAAALKANMARRKAQARARAAAPDEAEAGGAQTGAAETGAGGASEQTGAGRPTD